MRVFKFIIIFFLSKGDLLAQFSPQAGLNGSAAVYKDSSIVTGWASQCSILRGWQDRADTSYGKVTNGDSSKAVGYADGDVVSLGDGGMAIYYFENPIANGPGADFAIFENGFRNPLDSNMAYLELATVGVSNDGMVYHFFEARSDTDTNLQIAGSGEFMDCRKLNNLAGKYISLYGTPFDLAELSGIAGLDINDIRYVKLVDVTGSLAKEYCTLDQNNRKINDPYPTAFPTGGFDLDALAVMHYKYPVQANDSKANALIFYPNPVFDKLHFEKSGIVKSLQIFSIEGRMWFEKRDAATISAIDVSSLPPGFYFLRVEIAGGNILTHRLNKL